MNGDEVKKAAITKVKSTIAATSALVTPANGNTSGTGNMGGDGNNAGGKKRRKGGDLKPIITTEGSPSADPSPVATANSNYLR